MDIPFARQYHVPYLKISKFWILACFFLIRNGPKKITKKRENFHFFLLVHYNGYGALRHLELV